MPRLILASSSPYRRAMLARLGLPFDTVRPQVDEAAYLAESGALEERVKRLSEAKAAACRPDGEDAWAILAGDQVAELDGQVLGKPGSAAAAVAQLEQMSGREHRLLTAVSVLTPSVCQTSLVVARLRMRRLAAEEIIRYVAAERPLDCAGSYKIEGLGIALFAQIDCDDQTSITGLPLMRVAQMLRESGFSIP